MNFAAPVGSRPWTDEPTKQMGRRRVRAHIGGLHCSLCTGTIEKALARKPGVYHVAVSLTHEQALVEYDPERADAGELMRTLTDIGYTLSDPRKVEPFEAQERALAHERNRFLGALALSLTAIGLIVQPAVGWGPLLSAFVVASLMAFGFAVLRNCGWVRATIGTGALVVAAIAVFVLREQGLLTTEVPWLAALLSIVMVFGLGAHILRMAMQALRRGILNQHVLVEIGAWAGLVGGAIGLILQRPGYPTAPFFAVTTMVLTYHVFSEWLALIVKTRSFQAVKKLLDLQPDTARVVKNGREQDLPIEAIELGDQVRIRPGERIPVDGEVLDGRSAVSEALITGEPLPVEKVRSSRVAGGAINGNGTLLVRVTAIGEDSFLQRVIKSVEEARALKPGLLHIVDRVLRVYTPTVLIVATLALLGWLIGPLLAGQPLDLERAVFAALSVLVMGYPCAVGISAPLSIVRGSGEAAEHGVLMRTGEAFQALRKITTVVFDKTGTLTVGQPALQEIEPNGILKEELIATAAAVETASEHPLAQAIVRSAFRSGLDVPNVEDFEAVAGRGVTAHLAGSSATVSVGNPAFIQAQGVDMGPLQARVSALQAAGRTVIAIAREKALLGILALGDVPRADARDTVARLTAAGLRVVLLTGDNAQAARYVADAVGIEQVYAEVPPADKAAAVREMQQTTRVAMVGDGINDAAALMQADVGIAMGGGTDIAIESADIILLNARLDGVLVARDISRRSYRKMVQNISLAFLFNGIGIPIAATGLIHPVWAMAAMAASVTSIFINSLSGRAGLFFGAVSRVGGVSTNPVR
ncbi:MAG: cation-translocating P-type ATPase [Candidimonas sp.]|nr:MAG: cation-translocating P-type ATPase [Candidimonas sp.]